MQQFFALQFGVLFGWFCICFCVCFCVRTCIANCYSCQDFTGYDFQCKLSISDFQWTHNIAEDIARTPRSPWIVVRPRK